MKQSFHVSSMHGTLFFGKGTLKSIETGKRSYFNYIVWQEKTKLFWRRSLIWRHALCVGNIWNFSAIPQTRSLFFSSPTETPLRCHSCLLIILFISSLDGLRMTAQHAGNCNNTGNPALSQDASPCVGASGTCNVSTALYWSIPLLPDNSHLLTSTAQQCGNWKSELSNWMRWIGAKTITLA